MKKTWRYSFSKEIKCSYVETRFMQNIMENPQRVYDKNKECFIWVPKCENGRSLTVNYNGQEIICVHTHIPSGHGVCVSRNCSICPERHTVCRFKYDIKGNEYPMSECAYTIWH